MKLANVVPIAIAATLFAATLDAQRLAPAVLTSSTSTNLHRPSPTATKAKDYTWEGVAIGGVVFGALGVSLSHLCGLSDQPGSCKGATLTGLLAGATVGVVLGGMIGSGIKKSSDP